MTTIAVKPSTAENRVQVNTDLVDGVHTPIYKQAFGVDGTPPVSVSNRSPMPVRISGSESSQFGELRTASRTPIIELNSSYGQSLVRDVVTETGTGTVVDGSGEIVVSTGATASSVGGIKSADAGRYIPGYAAEIGVGMRFPTAPTGEQEGTWGGRNIAATDGFFWGYDVTGVYVARLDAGVVRDKTQQADWNLDPADGSGISGITLDMAAGNIFQIDFTWYGYGQIVWNIVAVNNSDQEPIPVHQLKVSGGPSITDPNLQVFGEVRNNATASNYVGYVGGRQYSVVGEYRPSFRFTGEYRAAVSTSTTSVPTVTFRSKAAFLSRAIKADDINVIPATEPVIVELVLNGTLTGASYANPTNYTPNEVACEVDVSATAITGGVVLWSDYFPAGAPNKGEFGEALVNFSIPEDQPISLCVRTPSGTGTCAAFFRMREEW